MATNLQNLPAFPELGMTFPELMDRLKWHRRAVVPRLNRLMGYYRNPMNDLTEYLPGSPTASFATRPYRQYQELGLPTRITGFRVTTDGTPLPTGSLDVQRKEVVIENDIAWRVNTLLDFALTHLPTIVSTAANPQQRQRITQLLRAVLQHSGGIALLQQLLLLGAVHGSSYLLLEPRADLLAALACRRATPRAGSAGAQPRPCPMAPTHQPADGTCLVTQAAVEKNPVINEPMGEVGEAGDAGFDAAALEAARNTTASAESPDNASTGAPDRSSANAYDLTIPVWAQALRVMALPATGVLSLASPALFSPLEPPHVAIFHDGNPTAQTAADRFAGLGASRNGSGLSARAAWLVKQVNRWLPTALQFGGPAPSEALGGGGGETHEAAGNFDLWSAGHWQRYRGGVLADESGNPLGFVPVIPFVNQVAPISCVDRYDLAGLSEIEPLLALQDELNTRLSDRASRVTMQSYRMYLIKGIDEAATRPVGPGQMWSTMNVEASIDSFGGDAASPSEDAHINEVREAMDKISGVSPVAAGLIRGRLGNLTSAVAMKITLIALLTRTDKRRGALTDTLQVLARRVLEIFDAAGVLPTTPEERGIDINWPSALPENTAEMLAEAKAKLELGISRATVLSELGYAEELLTGGSGGSPTKAGGGGESGA